MMKNPKDELLLSIARAMQMLLDDAGRKSNDAQRSNRMFSQIGRIESHIQHVEENDK